MKFLSIIPLAVATTAFVLPDQDVMSSEAVQNSRSGIEEVIDTLPSPARVWDNVEHSVSEAFGCAKHKFSDAVDYTSDKASDFSSSFDEAFDIKSWMEFTEETIDNLGGGDDEPPHHGKPPHDGPPHHGKPPHKKPDHKKPHHHAPNETVYQLISKSKYTTKLAELINEYDDLVELLNGTAANYTVFAPTDKAFEKIPKHHPKPSKEDLKKVLTYHVSSDFYPAGRVLVSRTIPTLLKAPALGDEPQRLSTQIGFKGLTVNFYSRVVAVDIFGTNGVIHGIDSLLVPPPKVIDILRLLPGEFSTLDLALFKTGLGLKMNDTSSHVGGTIFAPSNSAFRHLGPKINAFLFSKYGEKYLKALLEYHLVPNFTLYSDALYKGEDESEVFALTDGDHKHRIPKGRYHIDLPTTLEGKSLAIDIARFGRLIEIKINGYNRVAIPDGIAKDGVVHVLNSVLIPPKKPGVLDTEVEGEMSVEELKERLEPYVQEEEWSMDF